MKLTDELTRDEERQVVNALVKAIEQRPGDWKFGENTTDDQKSRIRIWTSSGRQYVRIYAPEECRTKLHIHSRWRLWRALTRLRRATPHSTATFLAIMAALDGVTP